MDAGHYTIVLINKNTKEEQRRSFQLLVNGITSLILSAFFISLLELLDAVDCGNNPRHLFCSAATYY